MVAHTISASFLGRTCAFLFLTATWAASSAVARADAGRDEIEAVVREYLSRDPSLVQQIIKDYLRANPEAVQAALAEIIKRNMAAKATAGIDRAAVIKARAATLFNSSRQVVLGNPNGDVTMVEFFDYNCGFCKRAHTDKLELLKSDEKLKIVLKELPVLGQGSTEAAQVAVAVRMQDPAGEKYLAFHRALMSANGPANKASALAAARTAGLDPERIERDLGSGEVRATIDESRMLAGALGITGTPTFVIGDSVVVGAVGLAKLAETIAAARR